MSIYEEVGIFLMTCAHGVGNRLIQEMFNHCGETIHRHFYRVLGVINKLAEDIIKPHPNYNDGVGYHMSQNKKYLPFFKNYIGVIDGTHIKAHLPRGEEISYIRYKVCVSPLFGQDGKEQHMTIESSKKLYITKI
ncbi:hypothetical protein RJ641_035446 [Dillenia turbinata]|uniref:DUF8040 domain-containing protein n=1 Tax=Dillenia turbinata TaxID=194707 RepID=A0AAN8VT08_9MAGN